MLAFLIGLLSVEFSIYVLTFYTLKTFRRKGLVTCFKMFAIFRKNIVKIQRLKNKLIEF